MSDLDRNGSGFFKSLSCNFRVRRSLRRSLASGAKRENGANAVVALAISVSEAVKSTSG